MTIVNELSKKGGICYEKSIEHLGSQRSFASPFAWTGIGISSPIKAKTDVCSSNLLVPFGKRNTLISPMPQCIRITKSTADHKGDMAAAR